MAGLNVRTSVTLASSVERAWELLCDSPRDSDWVVGTDAVTRTDGPTAPGSTYDERNTLLGPWKAKSHWRVVEFDPPRRQVHTGEGLPLARSFQVVMAVAPAAGGSEVTIEVRGEPRARSAGWSEGQ